jgi:hypothetical protein
MRIGVNDPALPFEWFETPKASRHHERRERLSNDFALGLRAGLSVYSA